MSEPVVEPTAAEPAAQDVVAPEAQPEDGKADVAEEEKGESAQASTMLKTKARTDYKNPSANNKFDPSTQPETDDPVKIRNQVSSVMRLRISSSG
jgi:lupus La protein